MSRSKSLYNADLAPTPSNKKNWGWFEIFNVWANDVQSLFGYTLAASLIYSFRIKWLGSICSINTSWLFYNVAC